MKKIIAFVFFFIISIQFGFSQTFFGIKGGANVANLTIANEAQVENKNRLGYQIGLIAEKGISENVFLRTELYYSIKGTKNKQELNNNKSRLTLNYINLPVFIGYQLHPKVSAFIGPQLGLLGPVYSKSQGRRSTDLNHIINYNNLDFGLGAGAMYTITPKISIDLRYTYGFSTIWELDMTDERGNFISTLENKNNRTLELSMNYFFRPKQ